ncbi:heterokaryon incompatibility protein-domain-containing protein [Triangularia setosa]|uniref:Heterokaryon incompatibility protein-domain-containing protein n=1 Tax=Triangularia setosa TaxID=2587417 RepID=A0AAN6VWL5_9PEZI|nr:heterokaryon incompatibility protein-domain-containing protein [Podospora setosa]
MPTRCQPCTKLSIRHLFELAKELLTYYKHHGSFSDLEQSAANGCDMCELIIEAFKLCPADRGEKEMENYYANGCEIHKSMYAAARSLEKSEVRMAFDSSYAYAFTDEGLKLTSRGTGVSNQSPILDILSVQYDSDTSDDEGQEYEYDLPVVPLRLVVPRDQPVLLETIRIGTFQVDSNPRSQENFDISRSWLEECQRRHECSQENEVPSLPTRVIDVGTADTKFSTLRVMHSCKARGQYVALNAITITRELGIQYLWIDSLCIIQDSRDDWEIESKRMAQVYGSATVTISALVSKGSAEGILSTTPNLRPTPRPTPVLLQVTSEQVEWRHLDEEENLKGLDIWCPLNSRGWTFQEFLLSERQLLYGTQHIYWRCPAGQKSAEAGCLLNGTKMADTIFPTISVALNEVVRPSLLHDYYSAVETYSTRRLTFGSDKLPAFNDIRIDSCPHHVPYRSLSWSRAITDRIVRWSEFKTEYGAGPLDMKVIEANTIPKSSRNPFGELICSNQILCENQFEEANDDPTIGEGWFDELYDDKAKKEQIYPMTRLIPTHTPNSLDRDTSLEFDRIAYKRRDYLALLIRISTVKNPFQEDGSIVYDSDAKALCLAVRRVEGRAEDVYERVGVLEIRKWDIGWIQDWGLRTITLI